ncbi:zinc finger MYM-type 1-like [Paramuricea clavata]|uniref:Zinc finger MYM-type 1-like n=1 Tax=Paramuricea clavata TaxID=317549 RepID=A0A6S7ILV6_PARCT|nr:zinc finger MYM-type 1-like [Paramuricea clavata]
MSNEMESALGDVVLNDSLLENSFDIVAEFYNVDRSLFEVEKSRLCDLLPVLYKAANILASMPATSCTAERSFRQWISARENLPPLDNGRKRLNYIAVINIERAYANPTIKNDMVKIIDTFGRRNGRNSYFF